jgi:hypothetical protein
MKLMKWYFLVSQMHFPQLTSFVYASCSIIFLNLCDLHPYVVLTLAKTTKDIHCRNFRPWAHDQGKGL